MMIRRYESNISNKYASGESAQGTRESDRAQRCGNGRTTAEQEAQVLEVGVVFADSKLVESVNIRRIDFIAQPVQHGEV